jgi:hypothetical protein
MLLLLTVSCHINICKRRQRGRRSRTASMYYTEVAYSMQSRACRCSAIFPVAVLQEAMQQCTQLYCFHRA